MNNLQEAYLSVYQELDEVRGSGRVDPVSNFPFHSERGSRRPEDAGLKMSPLDRAEARANALRKRENPEATRRANRITSRFVGPTKRGLARAVQASNTARFAEKKRLMNPQESYDLFNYLLEYLVAEGYADTNKSAIAIMENMSEGWVDEILDEARIDQGKTDKEKAIARSERGTGGDIGHHVSRGLKKTKHPERTHRVDREGNPTGKYLIMKHEKDQAQRERDSNEQRERDRGAQSRGTWDRG